MLQKSPLLIDTKSPIFLTPNGHSGVLDDVQQPPRIEILATKMLREDVSLRAMIERAGGDWVTDFQMGQHLDIYAVLIRRPVRKGTDGLEISDYGLQVCPIPSLTREQVESRK